MIGAFTTDVRDAVYGGCDDRCQRYRTAAWQYKVGDVRILVIGATGVLGRSTVRQLVRQGHEVVALVKSAESAAVASFAGATPIIGSLFDERIVANAMPAIGRSSCGERGCQYV